MSPGAWWAERSARERRILVIGAGVVLVVLVLGGLLPLQRHVGALEQHVQRQRTELQWLRSVAPQLSQLKSTSAPAPIHEPLVVLADRESRRFGLEHSLVGSQPSGAGGLRVQFQNAPFDRLVAWVSGLQQHYALRVESSSIDASDAAGSVNATLLLRKP